MDNIVKMEIPADGLAMFPEVPFEPCILNPIAYRKLIGITFNFLETIV